MRRKPAPPAQSLLAPDELHLLLPKHKLGRILNDPMGGCENQELHHMVEVVLEVLVPKSAVINDLVVPHGVGIFTDALPPWIQQSVRKVVSPH